MEEKLFIDIEKIFREKNPGAYKWTPSFVVNYLKKVLHEDELNHFQSRAKDIYGLAYCAETIRELNLNIVCKGLEHIPKTGGFILVSNHPLGGIDGITLINEIGKVRQDISFLVNDILANLKNFGDLFTPINKMGSNSKENLKNIENLYASDKGILLFPAGLVSRKGKSGIKDLEWNKSFVSKAIKYQKPVIPTFIDGQMSDWFYGLSNFRNAIGIKTNIEMLYLADELFNMKGNTINITIGKPISPQQFTKEKDLRTWADIVRHFVYELKQNPDKEFLIK